LGDVLLTEIGGAMGPLYGTFFMEMASACEGKSEIDALLFGQMLKAGLEGIQGLGNAKVGDKTLMDTLFPAQEAYAAALAEGQCFGKALNRMAEAAERGKESTRELVAKIGRASRLGERSRGVLDAGATSCCLILKAFDSSINHLI
jgi:dihydroxyacetone kinase-like protein